MGRKIGVLCSSDCKGAEIIHCASENEEFLKRLKLSAEQHRDKVPSDRYSREWITWSQEAPKIFRFGLGVSYYIKWTHLVDDICKVTSNPCFSDSTVPGKECPVKARCSKLDVYRSKYESRIEKP